MGLEPTLRLVVNADRDLRELPLTPQDFFLFSRVEALAGGRAPTVSEIATASGLPTDEAHKAIAHLLELGVLGEGGAAEERKPKAQPSPSSASPSTAGEDLRERARSRRQKLLRAQLRMAKSGSGSESEADDEPGLPVSASGEFPQVEAEPERAKPILERVTPVDRGDSRLDPELAIPLDRQRRLLALRDNLGRVGHFELLGLLPADDPRAIRRAYHVVSRDFHPDALYGKDIGAFRPILDDLFRRCRASYQYLMDDGRRAALVEAHTAEARAAREQQEAIQARRREHSRQTEDAEAEQARKAREERDAARKERVRKRLLSGKTKLAAEHAERAQLELDAGRHGTAATLFRLAHEHDPSNPEYAERWRESLATARRQRAEAKFVEGRDAKRAGRIHEAARALAEAADADPSLRNLSEAAGTVCETDPSRARDYALAALEALQQAQSQGEAPDDRNVAAVHFACARAFLKAGQTASAKEQADQAHALAPSEQTRTLLNSIKLA